MEKKNIKKLFAGLGLACVLTAGAMSAYFADSKEVTNVFTLNEGLKDKITLTEPNFDEEEAKNIVPLKVIAKDPTITNNSTIDVFAFMTVEIPVSNVETENDSATSDQELFTFTANTGWKQIEKTTGSASVTYVFAYAGDTSMTALAPAASSVLFDEVQLINLKEGTSVAGTTQNIVVKAYAIQAEGIEDTTSANVWSLVQNTVK